MDMHYFESETCFSERTSKNDIPQLIEAPNSSLLSVRLRNATNRSHQRGGLEPPARDRRSS